MYTNCICLEITNNFSAIINYTHIGKTVFIRYTGKHADPKLIEATKKLENYPCYDDMLVSELEMEWENEAWNNWLKSDLIETLPKKLFKLVSSTVKDEQKEDNIYWQAYRQAMEDNNEYPIPQSDHVYINVERISSAFCEAIKKHFREKNMTYWKKINGISSQV